MAFTNISELTTDRKKYVTKVKSEMAAQLKNNTIQKFFYYDGLPAGGTGAQLLLFGKLPAPDLKILKDTSATQALGECFLKGDELNIILSKGRIQMDKLSKMMKEFGGGYSAVLVDGLEANPTLTGAGKSVDPQQEQADNAVLEARKAFTRIPKGLVGAGVDDMRDLLDEIQDLAKDTPLDLPAIRKKLATLELSVSKLGSVGTSPTQKPAPDTAKEEADSLWDKVMGRFDRIKGLITDAERIEVRKIWGLAEKAREAAKHGDVIKVLVMLDKKIIELAKLAIAGKEQQKAKAEEGNAAMPGSEAERLTGVIEKKVTWVRKAEELVSKERTSLEKIRFAIMAMKENSGDPAPLLKEFDLAEKRLNGARDALVEQRRQHKELLDRLGKSKTVDPNLKRIAEAAEADMAKLDTLFDDIPLQTARDQIEGKLKEMGAAIEWREKRMKEEIADGKHGMGRHGPQTGLEAQGVRASTSEAYVDNTTSTPKVKARGAGVTPDSASNPMGTAQRSVDRNVDGTAKDTTVRWNAVDITYAEEDGKRVIVDVDKTAKAIVATATLSGASLVGSMWATPVLEKRAFDIVDGIAKKMAKYQKYKKTGAGYNDFKQLEITLGVAESGGAGWGYMMKKTGDKGVSLDAPTAKGFLTEFQDGKITLEQLFKKLSVKMADTDDTGKNMVMGVTAIYRRAAITDAFKQVTMYPNNEVDKLEWKPNKDYTGNLEFTGPTPVGSKVFNMLALP